MLEQKKVEQQKVNPPYISQNVWKPFFEKMRTVKRPDQLNIAELKEYGVAGGQGPALLSALKFLRLVDDAGKTTDRFKLIQVSGDQFKKNLGQILDEAYSDLFAKHPLNNAKYEHLQNYFTLKYSAASAKKMAKSFAVLCQMASLESPAFLKMRSLEVADRPPRPPAATKEHAHNKREEHKTNRAEYSTPSSHEDLAREFIKANPLPTGGQWEASTLKTYFEEYRNTLTLLRGEKKEGE